MAGHAAVCGGCVVTRRITTLRSLRSQHAYTEKQLTSGLVKHSLTLGQLRYLAALDEEFHDLAERVARLQRMIDRYGDEWAKDDWPHACHAGARGRGAGPFSIERSLS